MMETGKHNYHQLEEMTKTNSRKEIFKYTSQTSKSPWCEILRERNPMTAQKKVVQQQRAKDESFANHCGRQEESKPQHASDDDDKREVELHTICLDELQESIGIFFEFEGDDMTKQQNQKHRLPVIPEFESFKDFTQQTHGGWQVTYKFENEYAASIVQHDYSYGCEDGEWELAVLYKGSLCYDTPVTNDVLGHLKEHELKPILEQIKALPKREGE